MILRLIAERAAAEDAIAAAKLTRAVDHWLAALPSPLDALTHRGQPRWVLLRELWQVEPRLTSACYRALGTIIGSEDPSLTQLLLRHAWMYPSEARRDRDVLLAHAPALSRAFGALLEPVPEVSPRQWRSPNGWLVVVGVIVVLNIVKAIALPNSRPRPRPAEVHASVRSDNAAGEVSIEPQPVDAALVEREREKLSERLNEFGEAYLVHLAAEALLHQSCDESGPAMAELHSRAAKLEPEDRDSVQLLWAEFAVKCPGQLKRYER